MGKYFKKIVALILAALLISGFAAGCADKPTEENPPESDPTDFGGAMSYPYDDIYAMFAPDTPMIQVDEYTVEWEALFYFLCNNVEMLKSNFGGVIDWMEMAEDGITYADIAKQYTEEAAISGKLFDYGAKLLGVELSEAEIAEIQSNYDMQALNYGGEDVFFDFLKQNYCYSKELYDSLIRIQSIVDLCFSALFGYDGETITDEEAAEHTADDGYLMAKHILRKTVRDDDTPMTDEEKAVALAEAEDILAQLDAYEGDDFGAFFHALMMEHSEDPGGNFSYPDGYLFQNGNMDTAFYEGCLALEIGEYSRLVESSFGYHIIYRIPIHYDTVPIAYSYSENPPTLRFIVANDKFEAIARGWQDNVQVTYSEEFKSLDVAALFG